MHDNTIQYITKQCNTIKYNAKQYNTSYYSKNMIRYNAKQNTTTITQNIIRYITMHDKRRQDNENITLLW